MKRLILLALLLSGCGLKSGFNNPLFWDLLLINSTVHAQAEIGCKIS
jgi:hypothetical protein